MEFVRLCWRDLWRNRRRTALTGLVMVFAVAVMIVFVGVGDGSHTSMISSATDTLLGHVQVQHAEFRDEPDLLHRLEAADLGPAVALVEGTEGVRAWAPRLITGGLVSRRTVDLSSEALAKEDGDDPVDLSSEGALVLGVDPAREARVTSLARSVLPDDPQGRCRRGCRAALGRAPTVEARCQAACANARGGFEGAPCLALARSLCGPPCPPPAPSNVEGEADDCPADDCGARFADYCQPARFLADVTPAADRPWSGEAVLGVGLAEVLAVDVGDRVALSTGTAEGRTFASLYRVAGLLQCGSQDLNRTVLLTQIDKLSAGLDLPGAASALVVAVTHVDRAPEVALALDASLRTRLPTLRAWSWRDLSPELYLFVLLDAASLYITLALLVMVVGIILMNVVTMSVLERTREYGVRLALGESPARIMWGLVAEVFLLAVVSCAVGAALGEAGNLALHTWGIDLGLGQIEVAGTLQAAVLYSDLTWSGLLFSVCTVTLFSVAGSLYPAWRIHRLSPVVALRFV